MHVRRIARILIPLLLLSDSYAAETKSLAQSLEKDLASRIKVSSRTFKLFRWGRRSFDGLPPEGSLTSYISQFFSKNLEKFWDNGIKQKGNLGNALYFAVDPVSSQEYGIKFNDWTLLEANIPSGMKYLDMRSEKEVLSKKTIDLMRLNGCGAPSNVWSGVAVMLTSNENCRKIITDIFERLKIEAINDNHPSSAIVFGVPESESPGDFILFGKNLKKRVKLTFFTKELSTNPAELLEMKYIESFTKKVKSLGTITVHDEPWPELSSNTDEDLSWWIKQNLYGFSGHTSEKPVNGLNCSDLLLP